MTCVYAGPPLEVEGRLCKQDVIVVLCEKDGKYATPEDCKKCSKR